MWDTLYNIAKEFFMIYKKCVRETSAKDPFNCDEDPDHGSALDKKDPDPGHEHFFKIY